ncbi:MAG: heme lyase CcmF/NrfE family subunit [Acidimicrobiia bacterium]|nr:heme lyase CcmF/NrfE family subunit [Acidimicrobiia bacterium]MYC58404.1 heme lyase CcmF/NrfE family subunit [Acidimicrobiia bacterium]MYG94163.1 heme lyase CcmF/NrfE family subunit [Acidimicrobiia bacterium]MYI30490.1 heme lyase CcmF/NrfE family subunit [Acidimicrobiia bacterium]
MNVTLGVLGIAVAMAASALGVFAVAVRHLNRVKLCAWLVLGGAALAVFAMERALITRDFSVLYVAENGSHATPALFNVATLWAALEGSILLWAFILAGYLVLVMMKFRDRLGDPLVGWAMAVLFVVCLFFFVLMFNWPNLDLAQPFRRVQVPPGFEGPGPNPLLQNHWLMAVHPPMLYLGYVGFTVPFAFAVAALVTGRLGEGWLLHTRRWTLFAWAFLTAGIILGAWWSWDVLGWGGYWGWDPVENASLLPWLTGTAYLHSVMVQERRGMLRVWNLSLVCATFALTILGTFLTRSGLVDSVHAFSADAVGPALLVFFALVMVVTVGLIAWRGDKLRSPGQIDSVLSREASFLANNLFFGVFAFVVLLGTVFPLIVEVLNDDRISVGTPFFNRMTMPVGLLLLFLMAVAPVLPWRKTTLERLSQRLMWPSWLGVGSVLLALLLGARGLAPLLAFGLAGFAGGAALRQLVLAGRRQGWRGLLGRANGGMVVHLGVVVVAVAVAASNSYLHQSEFSVAPGEVAYANGHEIVYLSTREKVFDNKITTEAVVLVDGEAVRAGVSRFNNGGVVRTPGTKSSPVRDIQVALLDLPDVPGMPAGLRVTVQPLTLWLWIGGAIMLVGAALSAFPGRRRSPTQPVSAPVPGVSVSGGSMSGVPVGR